MKTKAIGKDQKSQNWKSRFYGGELANRKSDKPNGM